MAYNVVEILSWQYANGYGDGMFDVSHRLWQYKPSYAKQQFVVDMDGHIKIVELLIQYGADVNRKNNAGQTPLDLAKAKKHTEVVELLKKYGAADSSTCSIM